LEDKILHLGQNRHGYGYIAFDHTRPDIICCQNIKNILDKIAEINQGGNDEEKQDMQAFQRNT
jgi:hypothetical protein